MGKDFFNTFCDNWKDIVGGGGRNNGGKNECKIGMKKCLKAYMEKNKDPEVPITFDKVNACNKFVCGIDEIAKMCDKKKPKITDWQEKNCNGEEKDEKCDEKIAFVQLCTYLHTKVTMEIPDS